jgi:hypothetical protein
VTAVRALSGTSLRNAPVPPPHRFYTYTYIDVQYDTDASFFAHSMSPPGLGPLFSSSSLLSPRTNLDYYYSPSATHLRRTENVYAG